MGVCISEVENHPDSKPGISPRRLLILLAMAVSAMGAALWYGRYLFFYGAAFIGAGHGPSFFVNTAFSPLSLLPDTMLERLFSSDLGGAFMWALWPVITLCALLSARRPMRWLAIIFLLAHYGGVVIAAFHGENGRIIDCLEMAQGVRWVAIYLLGQAALWGMLFLGWRKPGWLTLQSPPQSDTPPGR